MTMIVPSGWSFVEVIFAITPHMRLASSSAYEFSHEVTRLDWAIGLHGCLDSDT